MSAKARNRWIILFASAVMGCFAGAIYMWSIFNKPLTQIHGWSLEQVSLAYSLFILVDCLSGFLAGTLQRWMKTSTLLLIAGLLFSAGWFMTGFARSVPMMYFTFCFVAGVGDGFVYNITVSTATKWFPDRRGFANGVCVGCIGLSALFFAPAGNFLIESFGVENAFKIFGIFSLVMFLIFARLINAPDPDWKPKGWHDEGGYQRSSNIMRRDYSTSEALRTPLFWIAWILYCLAVLAGNMVAAHASNIGQALVQMTASQAAMMVGIMALGSFSGRFGFGSLSDKIGCGNTILIMLVLCGCGMFAFTQVSTFPALALALCVSGMCFGGMMTVMPSLCARLFGSRYFSEIYAVFYSGYMVACFLGPLLAARSVARSGNYVDAFIVAGSISLLSIILVFAIKRKGCIR